MLRRSDSPSNDERSGRSQFGDRTALAFGDPVAVILLPLRTNVGIAMTIGIIVVDVVHNVWIQARYFPPFLENLILSPQLIEQIGFMLFVLVSSPFAWVSERHKVT